MEWTIHGFNLILFILNFHLLEHTVTVKLVVTGRLPEVKICNMRCKYYVIAIGYMRRLPEIFNLVTDFRSLGMPENKSATSILLSNGEIVRK
jgi:hypothetical protein